jgi:hypothetical protein
VLVERGFCANGPGTLIESGWEFDKDLIPLYFMCHDKNFALNYYSVNIINGRSPNAGDRSSNRPTFSQGTYFPGIDVNAAYTQKEHTLTAKYWVPSNWLRSTLNQIRNTFCRVVTCHPKETLSMPQVKMLASILRIRRHNFKHSTVAARSTAGFRFFFQFQPIRFWLRICSFK